MNCNHTGCNSPEGECSGECMTKSAENFEQWWEKHGQFCRAGGGDYEKTFAFRAWEASLSELAKQAGSVEPVAIEAPDYHYEAMGCGLEDRNITDRYEAMHHGWECAVDRVLEQVPDEPLYSATALAALQAKNLQLEEEAASREAELASLREEVERLNTEKTGDDQLWNVLVKQAEESCKHGRDIGESDFDLIQRVLQEADASRGALILISAKQRETEKQLQSAQLDNKRLRDSLKESRKLLQMDRPVSPLEEINEALSTSCDTSAADELLRGDYSEEAQRTAMQIEKDICAVLGKQWSMTGMSVKTLVDELLARVNELEEDLLGARRNFLFVQEASREKTAELTAAHKALEEAREALEWGQKNIDCVEDEEERNQCSARISTTIATIDALLGKEQKKEGGL